MATQSILELPKNQQKSRRGGEILKIRLSRPIISPPAPVAFEDLPPAMAFTPPVVSATPQDASAPRITKSKKKKIDLFGIEAMASAAYLCNIMALSLPIVLVPMAATEHITVIGGNPAMMAAPIVAKISSVASIGGAIGMFINGFVCKELGTYTSSKWYLVGMAISSLVFSFSTDMASLGIAFACMEFFSSIQCCSFSVMLSDYYRKETSPAKLTAAITTLGLAATFGEIAAKVLGTSLSSALHWRQVAQFGSLAAIVGALIVTKAPGQEETRKIQRQPFRLSSITDSLKVVLGSGLFWKLSLAYSMAFVLCTTDKILAPFYHTTTGLPLGVCGGLTLSVTLGLVHGLISGAKKTASMTSIREQQIFLRNRYITSVMSTMGLTAVAILGPSVISNPLVMASLVALLSATMASSVSYQCYQLPAMIAQNFAGHEAIVIASLDGFGYLLSVPLLAAISVIVPKYGWSSGWGMMSVLAAAAGCVMVQSIPPILAINTNDKEKSS